jgi:hypothetical protein
LKELGSRWRVPAFSKPVLLLDAVRELLQTRDIDLNDLDRCMVYFKETFQDSKKLNRKSVGHADALTDWTKWTLDDYPMYQRALSAIHEEIQAELFQIMQGAYDVKSPSFGQCLYLLQTHIYSDEHFPRSYEDRWSEKLTATLKQRAEGAYKLLLGKNLPEVADTWEFYHVIELGKAVVALCLKIQKRYSKAPEILGARPVSILISEVLPSFAEDARDLVMRIMDMSKERDEEVSIDDGFELYRRMVDIRNVHNDVLPK